MVHIEHDDDLPPYLYHYTDYRALQSVFEYGEVWATNSRFLNDISETELGPRALQQRFGELQDARQDELLAYFEMLREEKRTLEPEDEAVLRPLAEERDLYGELQGACEAAVLDTTCFIFSMSKELDQLSQWRAYAKNGVCIRFSTEALLRGLSDAPALKATLRNVKYYDGHVTNEEYLQPVVEFAMQRRLDLIGGDCNDTDERNSVIGREMMLMIAYLKDITFREENEVRLAVQGTPNHFTPHRYGLVPRLKLPIKPDAIDSVIVGPGAHSDLRCQSLRTYFDNTSFKRAEVASSVGIDVYRSQVPYRDW
ncbi:hypothetical protein MARA_11010 [Mycolicibacterium arabiense]|uniref:DUF2971 domain-containing protein n=1 Tax=Mycolicibacterium arabiense TaxID=1286181 RepID=A0A7I7RST7_9MYCO|nr:DUF2971 domain-containing protein [Mycolicibacterium arabiense]MCV7375706.1 DUF2971 domain-containing protein [Mycolicibacterium arabiense]BBY47633.1 hypothetical protein MARA_11010 [Mycolicibacterium arabiense]